MHAILCLSIHLYKITKNKSIYIISFIFVFIKIKYYRLIDMRKIVSFMLLVFLSLGFARADEGMWVLIMLQSQDFEKMQELGLELNQEEIFSFNQSSLKDAVGALDDGSCTAELVSPDGLLLTNHHCGYDEIQNHSSVEHNYIKNGFWAMNREDELPNYGKTITFVGKI